jgi:hypothetical protein
MGQINGLQEQFKETHKFMESVRETGARSVDYFAAEAHDTKNRTHCRGLEERDSANGRGKTTNLI